MKYTIQYTFSDRVRGNADGRIEIDLPEEYSVCEGLELFWGNGRGILPDYGAICQIPLAGRRAEYTLRGGRRIPPGADCLYAFASCASFHPWKGAAALRYPLPKEKVAAREQPLFTFGILSDVHHTGPFWNCDRNRAYAYADLRALDPAFVVIAGDLTDAGQLWQLRAALEYQKQSFGEIPVFSSFGNHEYHTYVPGYDPQPEQTEAYFGEHLRGLSVRYGGQRCYYDTETHGLRLIFLNCSNTGGRFELGDAQREWLRETLRQAEQNGTLSVVVNHMAIQGTSGLDCARGTRYLKDNDQTEQILSSYGRVLYISGHTHFTLESDDEQVCFRGRTVYLDASCPNWTSGGPSESWGDASYQKDSSMGYLAEVYPDRILLKGRDFIRRRFIPRALYGMER